jgi:rhodanese-related sulfurtransferase
MFGLFTPKVPEVSAEQVKAAIEKKENIILLDVRTPQEFSKNRINGAINIPLDEIENKIAQTIPDKSKKIYVYCLSASRSVHAVSLLQKIGYTDAYNMTSGLLAWRAKQYPLITI